jgi:Helitron helicase-like domain at N-terminus
VSQSQFYSYHLQDRDVFSLLLYSGHTLQEFCVNAWVCVEGKRAHWARMNQSKLRSDLYQGLQDAIGTGVEENAQRLGRSIILPSSFTSGPRYMK